MSGQINLTLGIGGRSHVVSVAPEEEAHIGRLAAMIDDRVRKLGLIGQTEARMLLFAALVLADELDAANSAPPPEPVAIPAELPAGLIDRVTALADRVEKLAARLEQTGAEP